MTKNEYEQCLIKMADYWQKTIENKISKKFIDLEREFTVLQKEFWRTKDELVKYKKYFETIPPDYSVPDEFLELSLGAIFFLRKNGINSLAHLMVRKTYELDDLTKKGRARSIKYVDEINKFLSTIENKRVVKSENAQGENV